jgi:hypothetical protein
MKMPEDITNIVEGIDNNRITLANLMERIHDDTGHALLKNIVKHPDNSRDQSLFLLLVQNYVTGFLTAECDPPQDFIEATRFFYSRGIEHGLAYLQTRKGNIQ